MPSKNTYDMRLRMVTVYLKTHTFWKTSAASTHSSRMRTARVLTVSPIMLCAGGWLVRGGGSAPRGVSAPGGVSALGGSLLLGVSASRGCLLPGIFQHALRQTRPPVNRITHACENITLPQFRCGR